MTTYYVDGAVGSDLNDGLAEGAGNAWATINYAMSQVANPDTVYVKDSATYTETATIVTAGSQTGGPILFEGYSTVPGDNGKITIDGENTRTNGITTSLSLVRYIFKNFIITRHTAQGVTGGASGTWVTFINCEITNNAGDGINLDNAITIVNCIVTGNSSEGINADDNLSVIGSIVGNNGGINQINSFNTRVLYKNAVYGSTGSQGGINAPNAHFIAANTIASDGSTGYGVNYIASVPLLMDNIIYDWGNGVNLSSTIYADSFVGYNLVNSNTVDYTGNGLPNGSVGIGDVTGPPAFIDEVSDDYRVRQNSPAVGAGLKPSGIT